MLLRGKPVDEWAENDVLGLVGVQEDGRMLEFKEELHLDKQEEKQEFLCDLTSFANAAGGCLVFGVAEQDGVASGIPGINLDDTSIDDLKQRIENLARDGVEPRIPELDLHPIEMADGRCVLIIGVPKSRAAPHAVKQRGHTYRFYTRGNAGKQPLDVAQIRAAFVMSDSPAQRAASFRAERLARIQSGDTPVPLPDSPKAVLHIIPLQSLEQGSQVSAAEALRAMNEVVLPDMGQLNIRPNSAGVIRSDALTVPQSGATPKYCQWFRSGPVEVVHAHLGYRPSGDAIIPVKNLEEWLILWCLHLLKLLKALDQEPPLHITASFLGFAGYRIPSDNVSGLRDSMLTIDGNVLDLPEVRLDAFPSAAELLDRLRPMLDTLWNASGHPEWPGYADWCRRLRPPS